MKSTFRNRLDEEEGDNITVALIDYPLHLQGLLCKDCTLGLAKIVSFLVVFVAGVVLGLAASLHVTGYFSQNEFFPTARFSPPCTIQYKSEDCSSIKNLITPRQFTHDMTDEELFWRASMVPKKEEYPYKRVPKVAFLFLTRGPLPLLPLWDRFFSGHERMYSVYVHTLPEYILNVSITSPFYGRQIPSQEVKWGTITLADGERRLLANALLDFSNERFVLLSESCIPIFNFSTIYKYLISSHHSFVDSYDDPSRYGRGRYSRYMLPDIELRQWRKGSQWFELNRALAVSIISDTKYYPIFRKYCKPACYPDEHYLPTFLNMFHGPLNSNRSVTWVDWSRGGPHPATFGDADITETFIREIQNNRTFCSYNSGQTSTCYLFARKFAPSALEPLLKLSSTVMNFLS